MQAEAADVRVERVERARAARVGDPRPDGNRRGHLVDRPVGHAEDDEVGVADLQLAAGQARRHRLGEPRGDGGADPAGADHTG